MPKVITRTNQIAGSLGFYGLQLSSSPASESGGCWPLTPGSMHYPRYPISPTYTVANGKSTGTSCCWSGRTTTKNKNNNKVTMTTLLIEPFWCDHVMWTLTYSNLQKHIVWFPGPHFGKHRMEAVSCICDSDREDKVTSKSTIMITVVFSLCRPTELL